MMLKPCGCPSAACRAVARPARGGAAERVAGQDFAICGARAGDATMVTFKWAATAAAGCRRRRIPPILPPGRQHLRHRHCNCNGSSASSLLGTVAASSTDGDQDRHNLRRRNAFGSPSFALTAKRHLSTTTKNNTTDGNRSNPPSILSKEAATAPTNYPTSQRFWALPPAIAIHLSIGSVYVYSMWTPALSKALGVVASAPTDWTHPALLPVFSSAAVVLGVTTSTLGSWVEKVGPRMAGMVGSAFWSGALLVTATGIEMHSLPLVYAGYGVLGGIGWGLMYLTPVTAAMKWFPDRRGLATGIALSAFGAGAALAPGIIHSFHR